MFRAIGVAFPASHIAPGRSNVGTVMSVLVHMMPAGAIGTLSRAGDLGRFSDTFHEFPDSKHTLDAKVRSLDPCLYIDPVRLYHTDRPCHIFGGQTASQ